MERAAIDRSEGGGRAPTPAQGASRARGGAVHASYLRIALLLAGVAALVLLGRLAGGQLPGFAAWVGGLGAWGPLAFILGYIVATVAFAPGSILTLAAGAIFGLARGTLYVFIAATLGASAAFLVSRYAVRAAIERRLAGNERFAAIDRAIAREGRKIVLLLRLSPVFPFNLLNYALGLTRVRFVDYLVASIGMLPGTVLYVYYGKLAGDVASLAGGVAVAKGPGYWAVLLLGLAATIVVTAIVTRLARRALKQATSGEGR
ncbi:MAG TPA: TVP38/TMEM64 family protein [Candidatus Polarisedimenticolia bacterium]|nr:TVP38/TMEM64 family protein [Candidatus Polarisedimenticolia bacterium]